MATIPQTQIQAIVEAALMVAGRPLTIAALQQLFSSEERPSTSEIKAILTTIKMDRETSGIELQEVANGYRFQTKADLSPWLSRLWEERSPRYSRALLETLAIIAYKQPITRAEIEEIRGVTVSSTIMKTLQEREWVRLLGYREVPGKPAIYGTTKEFLDYFNLKSLVELPALAELNQLAIKDAQLQIQLAIDEGRENAESDETNENDVDDEKDQSQNQNFV